MKAGEPVHAANADAIRVEIFERGPYGCAQLGLWWCLMQLLMLHVKEGVGVGGEGVRAGWQDKGQFTDFIVQ